MSAVSIFRLQLRWRQQVPQNLSCPPTIAHSRVIELLAMSKLRLRAAVGLLTGHKSLRAHLHKLGHTERQECRLCGHDKEHSVHIVSDCLVLACKRYRILGCMFLKPEDLKNVRVSSLLSLMANIGLGLIS
jgi:hypothetical protein